jgi:translocator protein
MNPLPSATPSRVVVRAAALAALWTIAVVVAGTLGTDLGPWYQALRQPAWKPPDAAFGPAWTLVFTLTAWAGARAWIAAPDAALRRALAWAFGLNGALNVLWSWLFFKLRRPDLALAEVALFWLSIVWLIVLARRGDRLAGWLLLPYLLWVGFAAALNAAVVQLNPLS